MESAFFGKLGTAQTMDFLTVFVIVQSVFAVNDQVSDERLIVTPDLQQASITFSWDPYSLVSNAQDCLTVPVEVLIDHSSSTATQPSTSTGATCLQSPPTGISQLFAVISPPFPTQTPRQLEEYVKLLPISV